MGFLWAAVPLALLVTTPVIVLLAGRASGTSTVTENTAVVGRRVAAHLVDLAFVIGIVAGIDWILVEWAIALDLGGVDMSWNAAALWALLALDFVVLQGLTGYTLGKWLLRLRTVRTRGELPGMWRALVRSVPLIVEWIGLIALWAMLRNSQHQRLGDRWADTLVVADARSWPRVLDSGLRRWRRSEPAATLRGA